MRSDCAIKGFEVAKLCRANCAMVTLGRAVVVAMTLNNFCRMFAAANEDMIDMGFFNGLTVVVVTVVLGADSVLGAASVSVAMSSTGSSFG